MLGGSNKRAQSAMALRRLMKEYKDLTTDSTTSAGASSSSAGPGSASPAQGDAAEPMFTAGPIREDDFFEWEALITGPEGTPFEGGLFAARLSFPKDYPLNPFIMTFDPPIFHPNVYPSGAVCISILHQPGDDPLHYEHASERWSPVQGVRSVLMSVLSMLAEPNVESGANVECCKLIRDDPEAYARIVRRQVREQLGLPEEDEGEDGAGAGETMAA